MGAIRALTKMHREAVEQIRAGDHNTFLVGFLTTSTMLELTGLTSGDLRIDGYAMAAAETITQYAPIDRCRVRLTPEEFVQTVASIGCGDDSDADPLAESADLALAATVTIEGIGTVVLSAAEVAAPLVAGDFLNIAANQICTGLGQIMESERRRRRAAVADTLALIASLNEQWGLSELEGLAGALSSLPGAHGATIAVGANRLAGVLSATSGPTSGNLEERAFDIDERVQANVTMCYTALPTAAQLEQLDDILGTLSTNLSRIEQNIRLAAEAETDQLTGISNRRRVSKALAAARAMADRRNEPVAVLLFDLDHFKSVNDQLGHPVGDQVLVRFAALLSSVVRPFDTVARWGGEEFLLVCPSCALPGAIAIGQRVIEACPDSFDEVLPESIRQTCSIGVAVYPEHANSPESLISVADDALYTAKREGRNRLSVAKAPSRV
jgi:diguanylate cyclase (GGDEF)-like protein